MATLTGHALELNLVGDRHIVAEYHDIKAKTQRPLRLESDILSGHGYQREVGVGHSPDR